MPVCHNHITGKTPAFVQAYGAASEELIRGLVVLVPIVTRECGNPKGKGGPRGEGGMANRQSPIVESLERGTIKITIKSKERLGWGEIVADYHPFRG